MSHRFSGIEIFLNGRPMNDVGKRHLDRVHMSRTVDMTDLLEFDIRMGENWRPVTADFLLGTEVRLVIEYDRASYPVFWGEITDLKLTFPEQGAPTLHVECYDRSHHLKQSDIRAIYPYPTLRENLEAILGDFGFVTEIIASKSVDLSRLKFRIDQAIHFGPDDSEYRTAWEAILRICTVLGPRVFVRDNQLWIAEDEDLRKLQADEFEFIYGGRGDEFVSARDPFVRSGAEKVRLIDFSLETSLWNKRGEVHLADYDFSAKADASPTKQWREMFPPVEKLHVDTIEKLRFDLPEQMADATAVEIDPQTHKDEWSEMMSRSGPVIKRPSGLRSTDPLPEEVEQFIITQSRSPLRLSMINLGSDLTSVDEGVPFVDLPEEVKRELASTDPSTLRLPSIKSEPDVTRVAEGAASPEELSQILPPGQHFNIAAFFGEERRAKSIQRKNIERLMVGKGSIEIDPRVDIYQWHNVKIDMPTPFGIVANGEYMISEVEHDISEDGAFTQFEVCRPVLMHKDIQALLKVGLFRL